MMKNTLFLLFAFCCLAMSTNGQVSLNEDVTTSSLTAEQIIDKYNSFEGAVRNMSRAEWEVMRAWDQYDEGEARRIVAEHKAATSEIRAERRQNGVYARQLAAGDCDCWVEPDETYTQINTTDWDETGGAGADVDAWLGPIGLNGWSHNHYGELFNSFYINSKGTVSFGAGYIDWTPEEFPGATYDQIAGYWADIDIRESGEIWYKVTPEGVYVNFIEVGYFNSHADKTNTFQILFTPEDGELLPDGNNVQLCYQSMQWAHGDVGGSGGTLGPNPGNVGADKSSTTGSNIQYGRFNLLNANYNGPYGDTPQEQDGVFWLTDKVFNFNTATSGQNNTPPISTSALACDTITVCLNDTVPIDISFLPPETNQNVSIEVSGDLDGLFIDNQQNGAVAIFEGGFVGSTDYLGINTITFTATDTGEPEGVTEINYVFDVINVELPELTISGDLGICAGQSTSLVASDGFDTYTWSTGCDTQECDVNTAGLLTLTADFQGCEAEIQFELDVTPFELVDINIEPNPVCYDELATVCVDPDQIEELEYVDYQWDENWNDLGGTIDDIQGDGDCATMGPGVYRILAEMATGCFAQRVFVIDNISPFIPEDEQSGVYCDNLDPITFEGGFSNPAEGALTLYLLSSDDAGWNGAFIEVFVNGVSVGIFTSGGLVQIETIDIEADDDIEIVYVSSGDGDENNTIQGFNCSNQNNFILNNLTDGTLWSEPAGCASEPAFGTWSIIDGPDCPGAFSDITQFDTEFTPCEYGAYTLQFTEDACGQTFEYEVVFTSAPSITLTTDEFILCGDEAAFVEATITDIGGTATIDWPSPGVDDVLENTYSYNTPQDLNLTVTITNECGSDDADFTILAQFEPEVIALEDAILCDGGVVPLDPIADNAGGIDYEWTINGDFLSNDPEVDAATTGTYCVTVSNECFPGGVETCAEVSIAGDIDPFPLINIYCDGQDEATIFANGTNDDWTVIWSDGTEGISNVFTPADNGGFSATITDPGNCNTETFEGQVYFGTNPVANPSPQELITLCPEITNTFSLDAGEAFEWVWSVNCAGETTFLSGNDDLNLVSSQLSQDCWGQTLSLNGTATNPCGSASASFEVIIDPCEITIPNVFTPNGDADNVTFSIEGLDVYNDVQLSIFNRWGNLIYESADYQSGDWRGQDQADGTYWYVLVLPNGRDYNGTVTLLR
ncbi:MAG: gliding motility-associated C-terminal domain-containing protein [Flavobacteriales bacterium]|nr:gliding motility-associated C-terminal domain-containing protein [Flavobacteriales bacterium]